MPWTLRDIMSEATTFARLTADDVHISRVSFYVNAAQRDVANRVQQVEFERIAVSSTSSGDDSIFLPADCLRVLNLSFDTGASSVGGRGIRQANLWEVDAKSDGTFAGVPDRYLSYGTWLQLYPSPNSQYSMLLRYIARLSDITSLTAIPSVATEFHQAVLFKTVEYLSLRKGDPVAANVFRARYEQELDRQPGPLANRGANRLGMSARLVMEEE